MALMPKRVKHRKQQRGRAKGNATRGNFVVYGDFDEKTVKFVVLKKRLPTLTDRHNILFQLYT